MYAVDEDDDGDEDLDVPLPVVPDEQSRAARRPTSAVPRTSNRSKVTKRSIKKTATDKEDIGSLHRNEADTDIQLLAEKETDTIDVVSTTASRRISTKRRTSKTSSKTTGAKSKPSKSNAAESIQILEKQDCPEKAAELVTLHPLVANKSNDSHAGSTLEEERENPAETIEELHLQQRDVGIARPETVKTMPTAAATTTAIANSVRCKKQTQSRTAEHPKKSSQTETKPSALTPARVDDSAAVSSMENCSAEKENIPTEELDRVAETENNSDSGKQRGKSISKKRKRKKSKRAIKKSMSDSDGGKAVTANHEFQLDGSENPEIKTWLRKKNQILKQRQAEERKRERQRKKEEEEKANKEELRNKESSAKVAEWMRQKRLLQQRQESELKMLDKWNDQNNNTNNVAKISDAINSTLESQMSVKPIEIHVTPRGLSGDLPDTTSTAAVSASSSIRKSCGSPRDVVSRNLPLQRPVGGNAPSPRCSISPSRINIPQDDRNLGGKPKPETVAVPASPTRETSPARTRSASSSMNLSYEAWLRQKRAGDAAKRKRMIEEEQQREQALDSATAELIRAVARRRIDAILTTRRSVDTGRQSVDRTANAYPRPRTASTATRRAKKESGKSVSLSLVNFKAASENRSSAEDLPSPPANGERSAEKADTPDEEFRSRPWSAFPSGTFRRRTASAERRPCTPSVAAESSPLADLTPSVTRLHAVAPRPSLDSSPYRSIRYQQRSWGEFADYVWDRVNEAEGGHMSTTPYRGSLQQRVTVGDKSTLADQRASCAGQVAASGSISPGSGAGNAMPNRLHAKETAPDKRVAKRALENKMKSRNDGIATVVDDDVDEVFEADRNDPDVRGAASDSRLASERYDMTTGEKSIAWAERSTAGNGNSEMPAIRKHPVSASGAGRPVSAGGSKLRSRLLLVQRSLPVAPTSASASPRQKALAQGSDRVETETEGNGNGTKTSPRKSSRNETAHGKSRPRRSNNSARSASRDQSVTSTSVGQQAVPVSVADCDDFLTESPTSRQDLEPLECSMNESKAFPRSAADDKIDVEAACDQEMSTLPRDAGSSPLKTGSARPLMTGSENGVEDCADDVDESETFRPAAVMSVPLVVLNDGDPIPEYDVIEEEIPDDV